MTGATLRLGHSPDADDAFMFFAVTHGKIDTQGLTFEHVLQDIQTLNRRALAGDLEITAISAHAFPYVQERYLPMRSGASMGRGYGPILVAMAPLDSDSLAGKKVGIPGALTTANLLLKLYYDGFTPVEIPFDKIMDAVANGEVDVGLLIHEGQLTYAEQGFVKVADFGERWTNETDLPLPLGINAIRKDLGPDLIEKVSRLLSESIDYALEHSDEALDYALKYGRGMSAATGDRFVKMYVNDYTLDMGAEGKLALETLYARAAEKGLFPAVPSLPLV